MSTASAVVSTVLKGVTFENKSLRVLRDHLSMSLRRVGGKGDGGVDLQGWWWLPAECLKHLGVDELTNERQEATRVAVRVLAQCKAEGKKIGPRFIREFEGTILRNSAYLSANELYDSPNRSVRNAVVGLFASTSPFTKASILQAFSSPIPLALVHLPQPLDQSVAPPESVQANTFSPDILGTLLFNPALGGANGLLRGLVEPRWERSLESLEGRPGLWNNEQRIESWVPEDAEGINS